MRVLIYFAVLALVSCGAGRSLIPAIAPLRVLPVDPPYPQQEQKNAASATKDNSGTAGDQITKPKGAKESTLIGCLAGPDPEGKYTVRSMAEREGVQVLGPDDLKNDAGAKVKLTGKWEAPIERKRRFQVTEVEVISKTCTAPSETTPVSKNKRQPTTVYQVPSADGKK